MINYLDWAFRDNRLIELIHQTGRNRLERGLYSDPAALRADARARLATGSLFISLNRPREIESYALRFGSGLCNPDFERITRIPFDLDPARPKGQSATNAELEAAKIRALELDRFLFSMDWPEAARGLSGNGTHRIYRCALPNNSEVEDQLKVIYAGLSERFSDGAVSFDSTVRNAGRIFCLYGSTKRKGIHSESRPHRKTAIHLPQDWLQVSPRSVENLANLLARETSIRLPSAPTRKTIGKRGGDLRSLDIVAMFQAMGLYLRVSPEPCKHYVVCPWVAAHSSKPGALDTSTVIYETEPDQWPNLYCAHDHCAQRSIVDVVREFDVAPYCSKRLGGVDV